MGILDDVRKFFGGKSITGGSAPTRPAPSQHGVEPSRPPGSGSTHVEEAGAQWESSATSPPGFSHAASPAVQVLTQGPLTDLKRISKYLASAGVESQLLMPPGGCGT